MADEATKDSTQRTRQPNLLLFETGWKIEESTPGSSKKLRISRDNNNAIHAQIISKNFRHPSETVIQEKIFIHVDEARWAQEKAKLAQFDRIKGDINQLLTNLEINLSDTSSSAPRPSYIPKSALVTPTPTFNANSTDDEIERLTAQVEALQAAFDRLNAKEQIKRQEKVQELRQNLNSLLSQVERVENEAAASLEGYESLANTFARIKLAAASALAELNDSSIDVDRVNQRIQAFNADAANKIENARQIILQAPAEEAKALRVIDLLQSLPTEFMIPWKPKLEVWQNAKREIETPAGFKERQKAFIILLTQICDAYRDSLNQRITQSQNQLEQSFDSGSEIGQTLLESRRHAWNLQENKAAQITPEALISKSIKDLKSFEKELTTHQTIDETLSSLFKHPASIDASTTHQLNDTISDHILQLMIQMGQIGQSLPNESARFSIFTDKQPMTLTQIQQIIKDYPDNIQLGVKAYCLELFLHFQTIHLSQALKAFDQYKTQGTPQSIQSLAQHLAAEINDKIKAHREINLKTLKSSGRAWRTEIQTAVDKIETAKKIISLKETYQAEAEKIRKELNSLTGTDRTKAREILNKLESGLTFDIHGEYPTDVVKIYDSDLKKFVEEFKLISKTEKGKAVLRNKIATVLKKSIDTVNHYKKEIENIEKEFKVELPKLKAKINSVTEKFEAWMVEGPLPPKGLFSEPVVWLKTRLTAYPTKQVADLNQEELQRYLAQIEGVHVTGQTYVAGFIEAEMNQLRKDGKLEDLIRNHTEFQKTKSAANQLITKLKDQITKEETEFKAKQEALKAKNETVERDANGHITTPGAGQQKRREIAVLKRQMTFIQGRLSAIANDQATTFKNNSHPNVFSNQLKKAQESLTYDMSESSLKKLNLTSLLELKALAKTSKNKEQITTIRHEILQSVADDIDNAIEKMSEQYYSPTIKDYIPLRASFAELANRMTEEIGSFRTKKIDPVTKQERFTATFDIEKASWWGRASMVPCESLEVDNLYLYTDYVKTRISKYQLQALLLMTSQQEADAAVTKLQELQKECENTIQNLQNADQLVLEDELRASLEMLKNEANAYIEGLKIPKQKTQKPVSNKDLKQPIQPAPLFFKKHNETLGSYNKKLQSELNRVNDILKSNPPNLGQQIAILEEKNNILQAKIENSTPILPPIAQIRKGLKRKFVDSVISKDTQKIAGVRHVLWLASVIPTTISDYTADALLDKTIPKEWTLKLKKVCGNPDELPVMPSPKPTPLNPKPQPLSPEQQVRAAEEFILKTRNRQEYYTKLIDKIRIRYNEKMDKWDNHLQAKKLNFQNQLTTLAEYITRDSTLYNKIQESIDAKHTKIKNDLIKEKNPARSGWFFWRSPPPPDQTLTAKEMEMRERAKNKAEANYTIELNKEFFLGPIDAQHTILKTEIEKTRDLVKALEFPISFPAKTIQHHFIYTLQTEINQIEADFNALKYKVKNANQLEKLKDNLTKLVDDLSKIKDKILNNTPRLSYREQLENFLKLKVGRYPSIIDQKIEILHKNVVSQIENKIAKFAETANSLETHFHEMDKNARKGYYEFPLASYRNALQESEKGYKVGEIKIRKYLLWVTKKDDRRSYSDITPEQLIIADKALDARHTLLSTTYLTPYSLVELKTNYIEYKTLLESAQTEMDKKVIELEMEGAVKLAAVINAVKDELKGLKLTPLRSGHGDEIEKENNEIGKKNNNKLSEAFKNFSERLTEVMETVALIPKKTALESLKELSNLPYAHQEKLLKAVRKDEIPRTNQSIKEKLSAFRALSSTYAKVGFERRWQDQIDIKINELETQLDKLAEGITKEQKQTVPGRLWGKRETTTQIAIPLEKLTAEDLVKQGQAFKAIDDQIEKLHKTYRLHELKEASDAFNSVLQSAKKQKKQIDAHPTLVTQIREAIQRAQMALKKPFNDRLDPLLGIQAMIQRLEVETTSLQNGIDEVSKKAHFDTPEKQMDVLLLEGIVALESQKAIKPTNLEELFALMEQYPDAAIRSQYPMLLNEYKQKCQKLLMSGMDLFNKAGVRFGLGAPLPSSLQALIEFTGNSRDPAVADVRTGLVNQQMALREEILAKGNKTLGVRVSNRPTTLESLFDIMKASPNETIKSTYLRISPLYDQIRKNIINRFHTDLQVAIDNIKNYQEGHLQNIGTHLKAINPAFQSIPRAWKSMINGRFKAIVEHLTKYQKLSLDDISYNRLLEIIKYVRHDNVLGITPSFDGVAPLFRMGNPIQSTSLETFANAVGVFYEWQNKIKTLHLNAQHGQRVKEDNYLKLQHINTTHYRIFSTIVGSLNDSDTTTEVVGLIAKSIMTLQMSCTNFEHQREVSLDPWSILAQFEKPKKALTKEEESFKKNALGYLIRGPYSNEKKEELENNSSIISNIQIFTQFIKNQQQKLSHFKNSPSENAEKIELLFKLITKNQNDITTQEGLLGADKVRITVDTITDGEKEIIRLEGLISKEEKEQQRSSGVKKDNQLPQLKSKLQEQRRALVKAYGDQVDKLERGVKPEDQIIQANQKIAGLNAQKPWPAGDVDRKNKEINDARRIIIFCMKAIIAQSKNSIDAINVKSSESAQKFEALMFSNKKTFNDLLFKAERLFLWLKHNYHPPHPSLKGLDQNSPESVHALLKYLFDPKQEFLNPAEQQFEKELPALLANAAVRRPEVLDIKYSPPTPDEKEPLEQDAPQPIPMVTEANPLREKEAASSAKKTGTYVYFIDDFTGTLLYREAMRLMVNQFKETYPKFVLDTIITKLDPIQSKDVIRYIQENQEHLIKQMSPDQDVQWV